jgi:ribosomal protein S18 acetylase RimI-like enzyme
MIRPAKPGDAARLAQLAERTFRDAFSDANSAQDMELHCRSSYGESIQAAEIGDPARTTLVCEAGGELVGYGQLREGKNPECVVGRHPIEIQRIYVDAAWHGKGIAQALMASLIEAASARGADVAWLGVWERNPRAIAFYAKSGFSPLGSHVFVVGTDPQTDLILGRSLA